MPVLCIVPCTNVGLVYVYNFLCTTLVCMYIMCIVSSRDICIYKAVCGIYLFNATP